MDYVTAVIHTVEDVDSARELLIKQFGFILSETAGDCLELTNGAISIVLNSGQQDTSNFLYLALSSQDLDLSAKVFEQENFYCKPLPQWVSETRREMKMTGPHGINVLLYREYDEDELDILPSLPNELKWDIDADEMTRKLLLSIPITFRASARSRITRVAEADAIIDGLTSVTLEHACRAMFKTAPDFRHELLRETMQAYGLNKIFYDVG